MLPYAIRKSSLPLSLIHPRWHVPEPLYNRELWSTWRFTHPQLESRDQDVNTDIAIPSEDTLDINHRGHHLFVRSAYIMDEWLAQQPAHIAAQKSKEFEKIVERLQREWAEPDHRTPILPTPPLSRKAQFKQNAASGPSHLPSGILTPSSSSSIHPPAHSGGTSLVELTQDHYLTPLGSVTTRNPRKGKRRKPTAAEVAESQMERTRGSTQAGSEIQDSIVLATVRRH